MTNIETASKRKRDKPTKEDKAEAEVATTPPPARRKRPTAAGPAHSRSPSPVRTPTSTRRDSRRTLKSRDFDIDDVVVPFTGSVVIPVIQIKEIHTPNWRSITKDILSVCFCFIILYYFIYFLFTCFLLHIFTSIFKFFFLM